MKTLILMSLLNLALQAEPAQASNPFEFDTEVGKSLHVTCNDSTTGKPLLELHAAKTYARSRVPLARATVLLAGSGQRFYGSYEAHVIGGQTRLIGYLSYQIAVTSTLEPGELQPASIDASLVVNPFVGDQNHAFGNVQIKLKNGRAPWTATVSCQGAP